MLTKPLLLITLATTTLLSLSAYSANEENCPAGKHWNPEKKDCRSCPEGTSWDAKRLRCFCPSGQFTDNKTRRCVSCPANWTWDKAKQTCTCSQSLKDFWTGKMCISSRHVCAHNSRWDAANHYCVAAEVKKPKEPANVPPPKQTSQPPTVQEKFSVTGDSEGFRAAEFNIPLKADDEKKRSAREKTEREMENSMLRSDIKRADLIDLKDYNYILGVAATSDLIDETKDAFREDLKKSQASADLNKQYDSLRNQTFDTLDCYGSGAMVCLAALKNGDVKVKKAKLFGPQITADALKEWESLISSNGLSSVEIYLLTRDPIPGISYLGGDSWSDFSRVFIQNKLMDVISEKAPSVRVILSSCPIKDQKESYNLDCNNPKQYQDVW